MSWISTTGPLSNNPLYDHLVDYTSPLDSPRGQAPMELGPSDQVQGRIDSPLPPVSDDDCDWEGYAPSDSSSVIGPEDEDSGDAAQSNTAACMDPSTPPSWEGSPNLSASESPYLTGHPSFRAYTGEKTIPEHIRTAAFQAKVPEQSTRQNESSSTPDFVFSTSSEGEAAREIMTAAILATDHTTLDNIALESFIESSDTFRYYNHALLSKDLQGRVTNKLNKARKLAHGRHSKGKGCGSNRRTFRLSLGLSAGPKFHRPASLNMLRSQGFGQKTERKV